MSTLSSGLPLFVGDDETLARFLTSSRWINSSGVRHVAFLPNPHNGETSVSRHEAEPEEELWNIGREVVEPSQRNLHGVAFCIAEEVRFLALDVISDEPPERHANIVNWPSDISDPILQKAKQKEIAMRLAEKATILKKP